jgi:hypothetical protein
LLLDQSNIESLANLLAEDEQLHASSLWRLTGLFAQQLAKLLLVGINGVHKFNQITSTIVLREITPGRKCRLGCCDGAIDVFLGRDGDFGELLSGTGINRPTSSGRSRELVVDDIVECLVS